MGNDMYLSNIDVYNSEENKCLKARGKPEGYEYT